MAWKCRIEIAFEQLRQNLGVFPFDDLKYSLRSFSVEELNQITGNFSEDKYIGNFQFGRVYRGLIGEKDVTVKKWEHQELYDYFEGENELRQRNEVVFLKQTKVSSHPNLVKLIGYCCEGEDQLLMVYDLKPLNSVHNLVLEDSFTWLQRIKVSVGFAHLLYTLHAADPSSSPYLLRNIDAAHIMVDEGWNPILLDFSMVTGGIFPDWREYPNLELPGCFGYQFGGHDFRDSWSDGDDVFAYGTLLLMLTSKRVFSVDDLRSMRVQTVHRWGVQDYWSRRESAIGFGKLSQVHKSLTENNGYYSVDGAQIAKLAIRCLSPFLHKRPTMKEIVEKLLKLRVVHDHRDFLGVDQLQWPCLGKSDCLFKK